MSSKNQNGFAHALEELNTLINVNKKVEIEVLEEAANYFVRELKKVIPVGGGERHLRDELKVVVEDDVVRVTFGPKGWYWYLVEHGHKKSNGRGRVKGAHFVRNTLDAHGDKISEMMADKIMNKMKG